MGAAVPCEVSAIGPMTVALDQESRWCLSLQGSHGSLPTRVAQARP
jgi:hypothetical protein